MKVYSDRTLKGYSKRLKMLAKNVDLGKPEQVNQFLASKENWSNSHKEGVINAYVHYVRAHGLEWSRPVHKRSERLPNVPTSEQINMVIAHSSKKYAIIFSILRDTGLRPVELERLKPKHIDYEKELIYPDSTKGGRGGVLRRARMPA